MSKNKTSKYYADENVTRIISFLTILTLILAANFNSITLIVVLTIDFGVRSFTNLPSLYSLTAKLISKKLNLKQPFILATPKKFAAGLGFILTSSILIFISQNNIQIAYRLGLALIFFSVLEAFFKICVGCYFYSLITISFKNKKNQTNDKY